MSTLARICLSLAAFLAVAGTVYGLTSHELGGTTLLLVAAATFCFLGLVVADGGATARRRRRPEEEEVHVGPTIWPFGFAIAGGDHRARADRQPVALDRSARSRSRSPRRDGSATSPAPGRTPDTPRRSVSRGSISQPATASERHDDDQEHRGVVLRRARAGKPGRVAAPAHRLAPRDALVAPDAAVVAVAGPLHHDRSLPRATFIAAIIRSTTSATNSAAR